MRFGFPDLTDSFVGGQDILYLQFNEVEFYVEDIEQEYFYFNILKKLFPDIKIGKIFPLNGKKNVREAARLNVGNKKKIFIVDLDFDEILGIKETIENLFYLDRYSIENYLFSKNALYEIIREKTPTLKNKDIAAAFNYTEVLDECKKLLCDLSCTFIVIQKYSLGLEYFKLNVARDIDFSKKVPTIKNNFIVDYFNEVEKELKRINAKLTLKGHMKNIDAISVR